MLKLKLFERALPQPCIIPVLATALGNLRCLHLSPFEGSFQKKKGEPNGKWCLIVDLSSPKGGSVNGT